MQAPCNNDSCGHEWTLQKAPGEYKNGITCPACGSTDVTLPDQQAQAPATTDQQQAQSTQPVPQQSGGAVEAVLTAADSSAPAAERGQAAQEALGAFGGIISKFLQYQEDKQQAREQVARQANLEPVEDFPNCEECGYQFVGEDISLDSQVVQCPECGRVYELTPPDME